MEALRESQVHKIFIQEGRGGKRIEDLLNLAHKKGYIVSMWTSNAWMECIRLPIIRG